MPNDHAMSVVELANRSASELDARFRTLNLFVSHAGEVGRAHEYFLREILDRYLPPRFRVVTGFAVSEDWVSTQQDVMVIDDHDFSTLAEFGDCVLADADSVGACLEVKTSLTTERLRGALDAMLPLQHRGSGMVGLFAWEGMSIEKVLECIWDWIAEDPDNRVDRLPFLIHVRGQYQIIHYSDGHLSTPPLVAFEESRAQEGEGRRLLRMIASVHAALPYRLVSQRPWWLKGMLDLGEGRRIPWPPPLDEWIRREEDRRLGRNQKDHDT